MDALAPLAKVNEWSHLARIIWGVFIGIGFGFFLERGGLGNARVLAGQWFGYNFAVLRVMFTAIVVAMLGLFGLHYIGFLNLGLVYINGTYMWPQLVGGFIFGFGFIVGQYCPGTAIVGCATGRYDSMTFLAGFTVGILAFSHTFPLMEKFYNSSNMGRVLLPDALGLPPGVVVLGVVLISLGAFAITHLLDRKFGNVTGEER